MSDLLPTDKYLAGLKRDCEREIERGGEYIALKPADVLALIAQRDDARSALRYIRHSHGDLYGVGWDRVLPPAEEPSRE